MIKNIFAIIVSAVVALSLQAQSEPQKSPLVGTTPPQPGVKDSGKSRTENPPPPVETSPGEKGTATTAKIDKNPPPLDPKNMDTSVKAQDDFFIYANGGLIKKNQNPPENLRLGRFN